ncbi:hypothetical protein KIPE111705_23645 [Kibdelosporangium persicum]
MYDDDLARTPAWPKFGAAAAERGFNAVLSTVLVPDAQPPLLSGALNIYAREPGALRGEAADIALLLATHASLALAGTRPSNSPRCGRRNCGARSTPAT